MTAPTQLAWDPCKGCLGHGWLRVEGHWVSCNQCVTTGAQGLQVTDAQGKPNGEFMFPGKRKPCPRLEVVR